ncbi:MAG: Wzz/FepE/Etk N-terminal domain-containing protein, partial [Rhodospirillales bacterium]
MNSKPQNINYLREVAFILFSQKKMALLAFLLVASATLTVTFFAPPKFEAAGTLLIKGNKVESDPSILEGAQTRIRAITAEDLNSEVEILVSEDVSRRAVEQLLKQHNMRGLLGLADSDSDDDVVDYVQQKLVSKLEISVVPSSNVIETRLRWRNPHTPELILEALMQSYIAHRETIFNPQGMGDFFSQQADNYRQAL